MEPIDVVAEEIDGVRADPPHGAVLVLHTTAKQHVLVHIPSKEIRRLHRLLSDIIDQFPSQEGAQ
jgi:hypothetical protein